jgi:phosphopantothenoylcysteine decarboxylase/phosphopantothenate--cysteine ligase
MPAHLDFTGFSDRRLHLGVTGSIAAYKAFDLLRMWTATGMGVGTTVTEAGRRFTPLVNYRALGADPVYGGMFDADNSIYAHLEPGRDADALVVAPATANSLAKLAHGLADDLLSAQALSFPGPKVVAPAMNPRMWEATPTRQNWRKLKEMEYICIEPESGAVACADQGAGRLARIETVYMYGLRAALPGNMAGMRVLVGMGPTREHWDAVRFWSNPSTGTQGAAIAAAAWLRGAVVTAVCGPGSPWLPDDIMRVDVMNAARMHEAVSDLWPEQDAACMTAAVADFRPASGVPGKFKKAGRTKIEIEFESTPDILAEMGAGKRPNQKIIGFAAETENLEQNALAKLESKNLDLVLANPIGQRGSGFEAATNRITALDRTGRVERWPELSKTEVAWRTWDWILSL